jgi:hypothetical protein
MILRSPRYKYAALVALAMVLLAMIPQLQLWLARGREWNGVYVIVQEDEALYSAYINSLIQGQPRKNDPFGASVTSAESAFSVQFVPAYAIALPARWLHVSASTAFIALNFLTALFASLVIFWLLEAVSEDYRIAACGTLFVLCCGSLVGRYGISNRFFDIGIPAFHFLRRYQPAAAFPLFFLFQGLVYRALQTKQKLLAIVAGFILSLLIFSYLYLWTAAVVWFVCFVMLWFCFRERRSALVAGAIGGVVLIAALIPYIFLLSHRAPSIDIHQTLESSHLPDLLRIHEIIGLIILISVRKKIREPRTLFVASLALIPIVVFNQQIITGKLMQPFHFEVYVVNYSTWLAVVLAWPEFFKKHLRLVRAFSLLWGVGIALLTAQAFVPVAIANDLRISALMHLADNRGLVFSPDWKLTALTPTWSSHGTVLDSGCLDMGNCMPQDRKRFLYSHLYYSNVTPESFHELLTSSSDFGKYARSVAFGHERMTYALSAQFNPINSWEIDAEVSSYEVYFKSFSRSEVASRPVAYAVVTANFDFSNLDRWYERDAGERVGDYVLYTLRLKV